MEGLRAAQRSVCQARISISITGLIQTSDAFLPFPQGPAVAPAPRPPRAAARPSGLTGIKPPFGERPPALGPTSEHGNEHGMSMNLTDL